MACKGCETQAKGLKLSIGVRGSLLEVTGGFALRFEIFIPGSDNKIVEIFPPMNGGPIKDRELASEVLLAERDRLSKMIGEAFLNRDKINERTFYA